MIELRDVVRDDAERLFAWRREPEVDRWMYQSAPTDYDRHLAWLDDVMGNPDRVGWVIEENGRPCGFLMLNGLVDTQQRAQWGWYIGEAAARGRGAGRAAQALGLDRAFSDYGLQKVWSEVLTDNETALKAQAAAGFRREGYLRRHAFKNGVFRDVALLAILVEEWRAQRDAVRKGLQASGLIAKD